MLERKHRTVRIVRLLEALIDTKLDLPPYHLLQPLISSLNTSSAISAPSQIDSTPSLSVTLREKFSLVQLKEAKTTSELQEALAFALRNKNAPQGQDLLAALVNALSGSDIALPNMDNVARVRLAVDLYLVYCQNGGDADGLLKRQMVDLIQQHPRVMGKARTGQLARLWTISQNSRRKRPTVDPSVAGEMLQLAIAQRFYPLVRALYLSLRRQLSSALTDLFQGDEGRRHYLWILTTSLQPEEIRLRPRFPLVLAFRHSAVFETAELPLKLTFASHVGDINNPDLVQRWLASRQKPLSPEECTVLLSASINTRRFIPAQRILALLAPTLLRPLPLEQIYNPLLGLIALAQPDHTRQVNTFIRGMPHQANGTSYTWLLRAYSRRWNLSASMLSTIERIRINMVEDGVLPDGRHDAEVVYALTRRARLGEAMKKFMMIREVHLVESEIAGMLAIRLADAGMFEEAQMVVARWFASERAGHKKQREIRRDYKTLLAAHMYIEARSTGKKAFDNELVSKLGIREDRAFIRLRQRLKKSGAKLENLE